jgi:hypothetical protein
LNILYNVTFILYFTIIVKISINNKIKRDEPAAAAPASNAASPASNADSAKGPADSFDINNYSKILDKAPYLVQSCDQVLYIEGKTLSDVNDYSKRKDAFFTMSFYMINSYEKKDANTLLESVSMHKMKKLPKILWGTKSCVEVEGGETEFSICLPDKDIAQQIVDAAGNFHKCRLNNDLSASTELSTQTLLKVFKDSCLGLDISVDANKFNSENETNAYYGKAMKEALANVMKLITDKNKSSSKTKEKDQTSA